MLNKGDTVRLGTVTGLLTVGQVLDADDQGITIVMRKKGLSGSEKLWDITRYHPWANVNFVETRVEVHGV